MISANIVVEKILGMVIKVGIADCMVLLDFWITKSQYIIWFVQNVERFCFHG